MFFKINVKALKDGLDAPTIVATNSPVKDYCGIDLVLLSATKDHLILSSDNGRVRLKTKIPYMTTYCTDYMCTLAGKTLTNVKDFLKVLDSFDNNEILDISCKAGENGDELIIVPSSDPEQQQTLPCSNNSIIDPVVYDSYDKELEINRLNFIKGVEKVLFAGGFEEGRNKYLYWTIRIDKSKVRFVAGTGARFAIFDMSGDNIYKSSNISEIFLPVEISSLITKILKKCSNEHVTVKYSNKDKQYVILCDDLVLSISGFDPPVSWINEDDILNRKNSHRFTFLTENWKMASMGIVATNNDEEKEKAKKISKIHNTSLTLDESNKVLVLSSSGSMKAKRKVKLSSLESDGSALEFKCNTRYLEEILKYSDSSQNIQFEFSSSDKPLIVRFYASSKVEDVLEKLNEGSKIKEKFSMLIVRSSDKG